MTFHNLRESPRLLSDCSEKILQDPGVPPLRPGITLREPYSGLQQRLKMWHSRPRLFLMKRWRAVSTLPLGRGRGIRFLGCRLKADC
jgi:hypothetical protein